MIPRHRPPFAISAVLRAVLCQSKTVSVEALENAYGELFGLHAALLPSARAGICWALRSVVRPETVVIGPVYTCQVVHEAMARSGYQFQLVDTERNGFLMDPKSIPAGNGERYAIVLCEMYGESYESYRFAVAPELKIIDTAMTLPTKHLCERVKHNDCIVMSFGIGKCLYSGFGGLMLSRAKEFADEIKSRRDANLRQADVLLSIKRGVEIGLRTLAHARGIYRYSSIFRKRPSGPETFPSDWHNDKNASEEWRMPSTYLDRKLAIYNLEHSMEFYDQRINLAHRYQRNLGGVVGLALPRSSHYAMSHYTIRVPAHLRASIQTALRRQGVDTGTLFKFPPYLSKDQYANAGRIGGEVLNLPLDASLTDMEVDYVSDSLIRCLSEISTEGGYIDRDFQSLPCVQQLDQ